jgi:hypothetical protein
MFFDPNAALINIENLNLLLLFKVVLLIFIGLYAVFTFMLYNKINSLERITYFPKAIPDFILKEAALFYFLLIVSLFFVVLVIV